MRTTLTIDDDVLEVVRGLANRDGRSLGEVVSALVRRGLRPVAPIAHETRDGMPLLPIPTHGGRPVTLEMIKRLDEETP